MLLISVPRRTIPASKVSSTVYSWVALRFWAMVSPMGKLLSRRSAVGVSHGGAVRPARDARTPARFRTGVRIATDHSSGSSLSDDLRRGGAATTTVDHCTSPPFVHIDPTRCGAPVQARTLGRRPSHLEARRALAQGLQ